MITGYTRSMHDHGQICHINLGQQLTEGKFLTFTCFRCEGLHNCVMWAQVPGPSPTYVPGRDVHVNCLDWAQSFKMKCKENKAITRVNVHLKRLRWNWPNVSVHCSGCWAISWMHTAVAAAASLCGLAWNSGAAGLSMELVGGWAHTNSEGYRWWIMCSRLSLLVLSLAAQRMPSPPDEVCDNHQFH